MSEHAPCPDCIEHPGWNNATAPNGGGTTRDYCKACLGSGREIPSRVYVTAAPVAVRVFDDGRVMLDFDLADLNDKHLEGPMDDEGNGLGSDDDVAIESDLGIIDRGVTKLRGVLSKTVTTKGA